MVGPTLAGSTILVASFVNQRTDETEQHLAKLTVEELLRIKKDSLALELLTDGRGLARTLAAGESCALPARTTVVLQGWPVRAPPAAS